MYNYRRNMGKLNMDIRSIFANDVCKLIMEKVNFNLPLALIEVEKFYNHFYDNVKNVYQFIHNEIPLFGLYELTKNGDMDFNSIEEWENCKSHTEEVCLTFYKK